MALINRTSHNGVTCLSLANGVTNPISPPLVTELNELLDEAENDSKCRGVLLTSQSDKFFSIGLDIPSLFPLGKKECMNFYRSFNRACLRLFCLSKPTLCAIKGHATAGGCILAIMCDYRYMAEGRNFIGLNEIQLSVSVPYLADVVLRLLCGDRVATEMMYSGNFFDPAKAHEAGLADSVVPNAELISSSLKKLEVVGAFHAAAFNVIKSNRVRSVVESYDKLRHQDEEQFMALWFDEITRKGLAEAMNKF